MPANIQTLLCCTVLSFTCVPAILAQHPRPLIVQTIDAAKLYTLSGNTRPEANSANDQGRVADSFAMNDMMLQLKRSPDQEQALKTYLDSQTDSSSPNFHKWLTPEEFGKQWGAAPQDIEKITAWLTSSGFTVNSVYPNGMMIDFSGNAGQVTAAFHTEIHNLLVNGQKHIANMSDPQIPLALAPAIHGIVSLNDFHPRPMYRKRPAYTTSINGQTVQLVTPSDLATIYDFGPAFAAGYTGAGQTIAVVEDSDLYSGSDWSTFRSVMGLTSYSGTLNTVHPTPSSGKNNCSDPGVSSSGDDGEATIDAEWASAAAPSAAIQVAACSDTTTTFGGFIATQNLINQSTRPQVISMSYGECEVFNGSTANASYNTLFQQAVSEGISVFVSTGDSGSAACDGDLGSTVATLGIGVSGYASTPYNVAVGGTDFYDTYLGTQSTYWSNTNNQYYGSALSYIPEIPWNDSCASKLIAKYAGFLTGYGANGFCGSDTAINDGFVDLGGGSGGASSCATGTPAANGLVGGTCAGYAKPSWQTGVTGIPSDGVRDIPDVSMFAADGVWGHAYVACWSDTENGGSACTGPPVNWFTAGGTSFASPVMAGIQALVNQSQKGAQGNPNPVYYKLAASSVSSSVFHSISQGDITQDCSGTVNCFGAGFVGRGRSATPTVFDGNGALSTSSSTYTAAYAANGAYSLAVGIGSVDAYNLILNWSKGQ